MWTKNVNRCTNNFKFLCFGLIFVDSLARRSNVSVVIHKTGRRDEGESDVSASPVEASILIV